MHLSLNSYEKKYKKYKNKYQILKSKSGDIKCPLLNGGDCTPLPNPDEDDLLTAQNLLDLCPEERITIQNKCYDVKGLYRWIVIDNKVTLPLTQTLITYEEKNRLKQAYKVSIRTSNTLTRYELNKIYPNLQHVTYIDLIDRGFINLMPDSFTNLLSLRVIYLNDNMISELPPNIFNNLQGLFELHLNNNRISIIHHNTFGFLPKLRFLYLNNNEISVLPEYVFSNIPGLLQLYLNNNRISILQKGIFNNLLKLRELFLNNNQIHSLGDTFGESYTNLPNLLKLYLNNNLISELPQNAFNKLPSLLKLYLRNNPIFLALKENKYYGLSRYAKFR
jgi:Leucine-rich repeat (LRR) protein